MDNRITIDKLEFYITNVCNLTCTGCNRYNNYKFAGWQDYNDYHDIIQEWTKKIRVTKAIILGGEPLLNPTINQWIDGIKAAWPDAYSPEIISNGTRLDLVDGLYETCHRNGSWIAVSVHRDSDIELLSVRVRNFLTHPIREGVALRADMNSDYQFIDANGVQVHVWKNYNFLQNNIIERSDGSRTLWQSDPIAAHAICPQVLHKNYHFLNGKIYKCGMAPLMAEFDRQYPFDISKEDRAIIHTDSGLGIDEFDLRGEEFFRNIDNPIAHCKFCPDTFEWHQIEFTNLKPNKI